MGQQDLDAKERTRSLSRSKNADLLAFLLRENGYPAAAAGELRQNDDAWLNNILIEP